MKTNNISMECTHEGVNIRFSYGSRGPAMERMGAEAFTVNQNITVDGVNMNRNDRYDLTGKRLTEAPSWDRIFTAEYFEALDAQARMFAGIIE